MRSQEMIHIILQHLNPLAYWTEAKFMLNLWNVGRYNEREFGKYSKFNPTSITMELKIIIKKEIIEIKFNYTTEDQQALKPRCFNFQNQKINSRIKHNIINRKSLYY